MTKEEIAELNEIVSEYQDIDSCMADVSRQLAELNERNKLLMDRLEACKSREMRYTSALKEKYGKVDYNELLGLIDRNDYIDEKEKPAE